MASVVQYQAAAAATAMACEEEFMPQGLISCFGRSLSRASSGRHLEYCSRDVSGGGEDSRRMAQERSARAKLRWKAVAQEIMARRSGGGGGGGSGRRRKTAFSYDSKSYALNFDDQAAGAE
ncbi:hypothetical protein DAI22_07g199500 [Oryza sativa Japonica Group]|jgi:hypothetical protein|nr:hypothetical protein DAI22_07g199500 [Oryza sativa Japonica Group]